MRRRIPFAMLVLWILSTGFAILAPQNPGDKIASSLALAAAVIFGLSHGARRYGVRGSLAFFVIAVLVSNGFENLSIATGFPFGFYKHSAQMGPKLFLVPIVIGPGYFAFCYLAWTLANALAAGCAAPRHLKWALTMPVIAAFFVVGADLCADPLGSTLAHDWVYAHGGAFFGVPLSNYLGWFLVTWVIFQLFAIYLAGFNIRLVALEKTYWYEAAAFWAAMGLQYPLILMTSKGSVTVLDSAGWAWRSGDVLQAATILSIYTMLAAAVTTACIVSLKNAERS
jgi:putative membrane protein